MKISLLNNNSLLLLFLSFAPSLALIANWSNVEMRTDVWGLPVNSHSGNLYRFNDIFYLYGTAYQNCTQPGAVCDTACGYFNNVFVVYTSPDLSAWTLVNDNLVPQINHDSPSVEFDEVNVGFNLATKEYVMSFWSGRDEFKNSVIPMARSAAPEGPFTLAEPALMHGASVISDTISMFVDDTDNSAYLRYNTRDLPYRHIVEKLDPTWSSSTGEFAQVFSKQDFPWYDGGGMFRRGHIYYVMLSFDCCFCSWGSDALVFVAASPLGPWAPQSPSALRAIHEAAAAPLLPLPGSTSSDTGSSCNLTGAWAGKLAGHPMTDPTIHIIHDIATNAVRVTGAVTTDAQFFPANSSLVFPDFPGFGTLVGIATPYNGSTVECTELTWAPPYVPNGSFWCKWPVCAPPPIPPANWTNEVNPCGDGKNPPLSVANMFINPCSPTNVYGVNFTIPAQQFGVAVLHNSSGGADAIWYFGERFGSSPIGNKSADFQYFGPLEFDASNGAILPMTFVDEFQVML
jgi:hypothetical protein